jgi:hypothetical protein
MKIFGKIPWIVNYINRKNLYTFFSLKKWKTSSLNVFHVSFFYWFFVIVMKYKYWFFFSFYIMKFLSSKFRKCIFKCKYCTTYNVGIKFKKTQNIFILFLKVLIWRVSFSIINPFKFLSWTAKCPLKWKVTINLGLQIEGFDMLCGY